MSLTVLGCDGSWPGPGGAGSCYLVTAEDSRVLLDAGPGSFAALQQVIDPATVDAVIISHHHADHWTDLHGIATHARFASSRGDRLPVYAPATFGDHSGLSGSPSLVWHSVSGGGSVTIGALSCTFHRTDHVEETLAVRIDGGGRSLGYSADTGPAWSMAELGPGLDLLLAEATYTVDHEGTAGHMSGRQAGDQARRAGARRLVITHRWPSIDADLVQREAAAAFGRPVEQAAIGKEFIL
jgi:ribonuclease BN (tRNA processing enzyme)